MTVQCEPVNLLNCTNSNSMPDTAHCSVNDAKINYFKMLHRLLKIQNFYKLIVSIFFYASVLIVSFISIVP